MPAAGPPRPASGASARPRGGRSAGGLVRPCAASGAYGTMRASSHALWRANRAIASLKWSVRYLFAHNALSIALGHEDVAT
ncbi:hypothetical protein FRAHR75_230072 [Frankia sp. Hr75.2]|nr:hypothetical protein FRAHR75_230072 [Frankia sp. Hr75.2]SQD97159.1 hypothetical protein FMEAI12_3940077 [Parafrankia sp. Ea1.12]